MCKSIKHGQGAKASHLIRKTVLRKVVFRKGIRKNLKALMVNVNINHISFLDFPDYIEQEGY